MPGFIAKKLCPNLTIVPTNFEKYTKISHQIREVLAEYDRNFMPMSLDEAYLDITGYLKDREGHEKRMGKVNCQEKREIKEKHDTKRSRVKLESTDINENVCVEKESESVQDDGLVVVKQETDKSETSPDEQFTERAKTEEGGFAVIKYEANEQNSEGQDAESHSDLHHGSGGSDTSLLHEEPAAVEQDMFYNEVEEVVKEMRKKIEEKTQLTASAGIAPNMFLAKVCSDKNKPNGQFYLKPERDKIMDFVRELPLRKAFGIGRVSEQILTSVLKVNTCSELYDQRDLMQLLFTQTACSNYLEISLGLGSTVVDAGRERKSMSTETTFKEINKPEEHFAKCHQLCSELSDSLKAHGLTARKIGIKLKTINFEVKTRVCTASCPVRETEEIFSHAKKLLVSEIRLCNPEPLRLRLMGVRAADLGERGSVNESRQPTIISLMKKSRNVRHDSTDVNESQTAGLSKARAREMDDLRTMDHAGRADGVENSGVCNDTMASDDYPSTCKLSTNERISSGQHGCQNFHVNVKTEISDADKEGVSQEVPATFTCPVCGRDLTFKSGNKLLQMNQHVDVCLRKQADGTGQKTNKSKQTSKKRKREPSSNANKTVKRKPMDRFLTKQAE
jgi:DNA polymerase kappa